MASQGLRAINTFARGEGAAGAGAGAGAGAAGGGNRRGTCGTPHISARRAHGMGGGPGVSSGGGNYGYPVRPLVARGRGVRGARGQARGKEKGSQEMQGLDGVQVSPGRSYRSLQALPMDGAKATSNMQGRRSSLSPGPCAFPTASMGRLSPGLEGEVQDLGLGLPDVDSLFSMPGGVETVMEDGGVDLGLYSMMSSEAHGARTLVREGAGLSHTSPNLGAQVNCSAADYDLVGHDGGFLFDLWHSSPAATRAPGGGGLGSSAGRP